MKIALTTKQLVWLIIATVIATFLLSGLTQALITFSFTGADWVSALITTLGNISGGIIGGIVAIIVATYQVNNLLSSEKNRQLNTTITMLRLIREELRDDSGVLESAVPYTTENYHLIKTLLSDDIWKSTIIYLVISDNLLVRLNVCYRKMNMLRNLTQDDINDHVLQETQDQINTTLDMVSMEINRIQSEAL